MNAYASLSKDLITKSYKCCALSIAGKVNELFHYLKEQQRCAAGRELSQYQIESFKDAGDEENPFSTPP